jgi:hypothetical protein
VSAYAVILDTRADRDLTDEWRYHSLTVSVLTASPRNSFAYHSGTGRLRFTIHVDAETMPAAIAEALRVTERAARKAGFSYEAVELRALPSARLEEETMRLLSA